MLELVQLASACGGLDPLVSLVKNGLFPIVYIVIPIALLIYAVIDFGKAVIASDEKEVKEYDNDSQFARKVNYMNQYAPYDYLKALSNNSNSKSSKTLLY